MTHRPLIHQCGECSTLFLQSVDVTLSNPHEVLDCCPNPACLTPVTKSEPVCEAAVSWQFMHIIKHSGIDEVRRNTLRAIAESQMGPWEFAYRSL
jgi:hypothetical protein